MASTFKFHSQINETVPWMAQYSFPTQQTKVNKQIVKLPPKNGGTFRQNDIIRIEFPADNYLNTLNSVLTFDLSVADGSNAQSTWKMLQLQRGGAQNLVKRLRVLYGSLVLEDIQEYKTLVRIFTELGVQQDYMASSGNILDGMSTTDSQPWDSIDITAGRQLLKAEANWPSDTASDLRDAVTSGEFIANDALRTTRTFALNLLSGLLTSKKLLPLKWMAAQLSIEITLASASEAFLDRAPQASTETVSILTGGSNQPVSYTVPADSTTFVAASYTVENVNYVAELVEFDSTYDQAFFMGLQQGGVPIKFSSWHYHSFNLSGNSYIAQIHERSRSVKAAFAVVRDSAQPAFYKDSDRFFHAIKHDFNTTTTGWNAGKLDQSIYQGAIYEYQWRVGGRYYPSQPVRCMGGGAEAYTELLKTINALGDYTRASSLTQYTYSAGLAYAKNATTPTVNNDFTTRRFDGKFIMGCEFENTDVMPDTIAGINAEEQSDIALSIKAYDNAANKKLDVFMHFDCLIVVRDGNVVELIM